jgi:hypothetical protein
MTAKAIKQLLPDDFWDPAITQVHEEIERDLALVLNVDRHIVSQQSKFIKTHLTKLAQHMFSVTSGATQDLVSVRISLALGSTAECTSTRQWGFGTEKDAIVSDWAFGLVKVDQHGVRTTLRPGVVMTEAIFKHTQTIL